MNADSTEKRMRAFGAPLRDAAAELAAAGSASPLLKSAHLGTWGNLQK